MPQVRTRRRDEPSGVEDTAARPAPGGPAQVLALQRSAGNRAVTGMLAERQIQRTNTIVDNPSDPQNTLAPGTGTGMLKTGTGTAHEQIHPTVTFGPLRNDCGTSMDALIIPTMDDLGGTEPQQGSWPDWWAANKPTDHNWWVRGHLLNHNLGGPGQKRNLTPITKKCNSEHHNLVERLCKSAAERGWMLAYSVEALYDGTGPTGLGNDRAYAPDPSVLPNITTGFQCKWVFQNGNAKVTADASHFVPNRW